MCTLMVFARDNSHADAEKNRRGCWKRGMIFAVYEDGVCTEAPSPDSPFIFVHVSNATKAQAEKYMGIYTDQNGDDYRRREWFIDYSTLPANVKTTIRDERQITVTRNQVLKYIRSLRTNLLEG